MPGRTYDDRGLQKAPYQVEESGDRFDDRFGARKARLGA
jgi:hypothetical protein